MRNPTLEAEILQLREEQRIAAEEFRSPKDDWYHKAGAWQGICDLTAEEALLLLELHSANAANINPQTITEESAKP